MGSFGRGLEAQGRLGTKTSNRTGGSGRCFFPPTFVTKSDAMREKMDGISYVKTKVSVHLENHK